MFGGMRNHLLSKKLSEFKSNPAPLILGRLVKVLPFLLSFVQIPPGKGEGQDQIALLCSPPRAHSSVPLPALTRAQKPGKQTLS